MTRITKTLALVAAGTVLAASAYAQSARDIRGATPYIELKNEPPPKLIVDDPLPEGLAIGVFWAQYRAENVRILPVFGAGALQASPRIGHLHIIVDDLPWWWADASDSNTIDIAGLPPGIHKVKISLVDANHNVFPGQEVTLTFTVPEYDRAKVYGHGHSGLAITEAERTRFEAEVRAAENAFAKTFADRDRKAFTTFVAEDAVFFGRDGVNRGKKAVVDSLAGQFEGPTAPFRWESEQAVASDSGTLAHSSGPVYSADEKRFGTFNSIWRREKNGTWKVIFDKVYGYCEPAKN